jgi:hypothetical protein
MGMNFYMMFLFLLTLAKILQFSSEGISGPEWSCHHCHSQLRTASHMSGLCSNKQRISKWDRGSGSIPSDVISQSLSFLGAKTTHKKCSKIQLGKLDF